MKKTLLVLLLASSTHSMAECYLRSDIHLSKMQILGDPTDIQKLVVPDTKGKKCTIRSRVWANDEWRTIENSGVGPSESEACTLAMDLNKSYALVEAIPGKISADNQLVCSDLPDIQVRKVRRGELIWESETDMHSHPEERGKYFYYKQARCRKFIERTARDQNMIINQGIICQANTGPNSKWWVIDKY